MANNLSSRVNADRMSDSGGEPSSEAEGRTATFLRAVRKDPLLFAMLVAVIIGVASGSVFRQWQPSSRQVELLGKQQRRHWQALTCSPSAPRARSAQACLGSSCSVA